MELEQEYKQKIIGILSVLFPNATIYLFGSRARSTHDKSSDIDIAIDAGKKLYHTNVGEARDMLAESNIPYCIDIVDLHSVSTEMKKQIKKEGILWKR